MRYIGHLDLARALARAVNRARLPVAYTQGFNRQPRLSLAAALPLGYTSDAELADIWLLEAMSPDEVQTQLASKLPPGIALHRIDDIPLNAPSLQQQLAESSYEVAFLDPVDQERLAAEVDRVLSAETLMRERKKDKQKPQVYDLRPLILDLAVAREVEGSPVLAMRLRQTAGQFGRPDEVLRELGFDPLDTRVNRVAIGLSEKPLPVAAPDSDETD